MSKKTLLVEIGTEELPPKILRRLAESFSRRCSLNLKRVGFSYDSIQWFATPRRLALKIEHLDYQIDDKMKKNDLFSSKSLCTTDNSMKKITKNLTQNYDYDEYSPPSKIEPYRIFTKREDYETLISDIISTSLEKLPIQKLMRYGINNIYFVRPVRTVTLLLGKQVISTTILGVKSDRVIRGHRFMGDSEFTIDHADQYPQILIKRGKVIADYEQRKAKIKSDIEEAAFRIGGYVSLNNLLLEEVTSLVEWPVVLVAKFEKKFLIIPDEILVHIMKSNRKYFPVYSTDNKLLPNFIFVANIESKNPGKVISGNEKVMKACLSDAEFFFKTDRKKRLEAYLPCLRKILFHQELGTLYDRTNRIQSLAGWIAKQIDANVHHAIRAGILSKCDLMTNMVFEFSDIQGVVGMYYARLDGEVEDVSVAIKEQYQPRFSGDILPSNPISCALSIADKMDILIGIFGICQYPKSDKDPFALRRAALGILRIIVEKDLRLDLQLLAEESARLYKNQLTNFNVVSDVVNFILGRFRSWYKYKGYGIDVIQAVLACHITYPSDFDSRIKAVSYFRTLEVSKKLALANKRISNILEKSNETLNNVFHTSLLKEEAEINLARNLMVVQDKFDLYFSEGKYQSALIELVSLSGSVDEFFEKVMVNIEDKNVRINRLTLLSKLQELFMKVADISLLHLIR